MGIKNGIHYRSTNIHLGRMMANHLRLFPPEYLLQSWIDDVHFIKLGCPINILLLTGGKVVHH